MLRKSASALPEWSRKILAFRHILKLTQGELGKRLSRPLAIFMIDKPLRSG
jgi:hypothetical protein